MLFSQAKLNVYAYELGYSFERNYRILFYDINNNNNKETSYNNNNNLDTLEGGREREREHDVAKKIKIIKKQWVTA